ncbi:MAG: hypothetical protein AVDCRST_MAG50-139 [uncultured Acidimicrobiales bacterium]|uniref:Alpha-L-rhamnosidase six-hairpin glycosidase domain-containing protein n=1 Tax=uncultured Acidimicrobiales bacterium TaxID=310071 RepID=A0A6J4H5P0_9ACTN|nr:MAG: hypothetical protein AVDCRST_MAG50-139 [uncultured Acidimicrobiales bacterium]
MGARSRASRKATGRSGDAANVDVELSSWVLPYWLERQLDPRSPAFVPRRHLAAATNLTNRNWTSVGTVGSPSKAIVDPRGLVTPRYGGWSLDWWIGADDRWHLPSREPSVRQSLVSDTPVVETAMRVPGGDALHRVYAVPGEEPMVVVEITNATSIPFAVAFAVRPYNPEGLAVVERIALHDRTVMVDDRPALLFPKRPRRVSAGTLHDGDSAHEVLRGEAGESFPTELHDDAGMAQAAFVFPLAHRATLRVAVPFAVEPDAHGRGRSRRGTTALPEPPTELPESDVVVRSWQAQTANRGMRLVLPEGKLANAVEVNRRYMLLFHEGQDVTPGPFTAHHFQLRDAAYLLGALDRYGFHREADEVIRHLPERQSADGGFGSQREEWDANGTALYAMAEHWRLTGDASFLDADSVAAGAGWIERKRHGKRSPDEAVLRGLLPAGVPVEHLGPFDHYYWDDLWSLRGLLDAASLLGEAGRTDQALEVGTWAANLRGDLEQSIALVAERLGSPVLPAGPRRGIDPAIIGSLVACSPLGLYAADHPMIQATASAVRDRYCIDRAYFQSLSHTGLGTYLTLQLAAVELEAGDRRALDRLQWMLDAATPTYTWPQAIHPQLGGGCMGDGHHGWAAAELLTLVRNLLVREVATASTGIDLALCSLLPDGWAGQGLEVHEAPTHAGLVSFAVRWHGDRPALLWQLEPHASGRGAPVRFTAPGLDARWSSTELRGEALLAPFADFPRAEAAGAEEPPAGEPSLPPPSGSFS